MWRSPNQSETTRITHEHRNQEHRYIGRARFLNLKLKQAQTSGTLQSAVLHARCLHRVCSPPGISLHCGWELEDQPVPPCWPSVAPGCVILGPSLRRPFAPSTRAAPRPCWRRDGTFVLLNPPRAASADIGWPRPCCALVRSMEGQEQGLGAEWE